MARQRQSRLAEDVARQVMAALCDDAAYTAAMAFGDLCGFDFFDLRNAERY